MFLWLFSLFLKKKPAYPVGVNARSKCVFVALRIIDGAKAGYVPLDVAKARMNRVIRWANKRRVWNYGPTKGAVIESLWQDAQNEIRAKLLTQR